MIPSLKEMGQIHAIASAQTLEAGPARPASPLLKTAACHGTRDFLGQCLGRTAGLAVFTAITNSNWNPIPTSILIGSIGALAAGTQAFLISQHQIGTATLAQKTAVALCTAAASAAGASIIALGSVQPVIALAIGAAATTAVSLLKYSLPEHADAAELTDVAKATVFSMTTAASLVTMTVVHPHWQSAEKTLANRSIGVMIESGIIELCKAACERLGPSVNRPALSFNGKVRASLMGALPYVAATVLLNGFASGMLQPAKDSHQFMELWAPLMVGALSNAIRGAANAAAVFYLHKKQNEACHPDASPIRPSIGIKQPDCRKVAKKTAIRMTLSCCRNAIYFYLREHGMSVLQAGCLAQFCYSFFAQSRELIFDLMQGEGWNEPVLVKRNLPLSA